ncbi:hypothetical protein KUTeg_013653 [Tegillarca granosa]|uniref:Ribonuclease P/MRP protein subunit POP5 n=1 Tax=Tegillarca granosa TaxID=220873 RepID=A0ABQ9EUB7_TEGGR|nr:hypothetical protein KUTeg_013653 [Tegillarca granosa]
MLCEVVYVDNKRIQRNLNGQDVFNAVKNAVMKYHGDYGIVIYVNPSTNIVLVRAKRGAHQMVQSAMFFINKIGTYDAFLRTLHIGGIYCYKYNIVMK